MPLSSFRPRPLQPRLCERAIAACLAAALATCPAGCSPRHATPSPTERTTEAAPVSDTISLEGWPAETFALPPGFAPDLPKGTESLRFAPGWRDSSAEDFWSYAFVMWFDAPAPDAAAIDHLLESYYNGLMTSFAAGANTDISATPAHVVVTRTAPDRFEARMHLIDAFATFKPIDLRVLIDTVAESDTRTRLHIRVSPQPKEHAIWQSLEAAITSIMAQDAATSTQPHEAISTTRERGSP